LPANDRFALHRVVRNFILPVLLGTSSCLTLAQWIGYPTPGIPRTEDGAADMNAAAPRTFDNRPDFSGMWFAARTVGSSCKGEGCISEERMAREQINMGIYLPDGLPYTQWSKDRMAERAVNGGREDPHAYCMPPNFPRAWTLPQYTKIVQTPELIVMLHEFNASYRQVFLDGRHFPEDPNHTWNVYYTGHWEGDTLVIDTIGIRDDMWLDLQGSPITEAAHITERLQRNTFGILNIDITIDDPKAYTRPWTVALEHAIEVDTQMLDEICLDDEQDVELYQ